MGWNDAPDYTPRNPPWWLWLTVAAVVMGFIAVSVATASAQTMSETDVQKCACDGYEMEVPTEAGTFVDCLSDTHAIEVEATQDWAEAIGQSLHYGHETAKRGKVLFFCEQTERSCLKHMLAFEATVNAYGLPIDWGYAPDVCLETGPDADDR